MSTPVATQFGILSMPHHPAGPALRHCGRLENGAFLVTFDRTRISLDLVVEALDRAFGPIEYAVETMPEVTAVPESKRWAQEIYDRAVAGGLPIRCLLQVTEALHSPDPIAAVEWLLSVEQDETSRAGFQAALDTLRARRGGGE